MLNYYLHERTKEDYIYSCDKICIKGKLEFININSFGRSLSDFLLFGFGKSISDDMTYPWSVKSLKDYKCYEKYGMSDFHYNLNITLTDDSSFYFAYQHNSQKLNECSWKIELNPNKCLPCDFVLDFIHHVYSFSKQSSIEISQMDVAIDFPLERSCFYLEKDKRISTIINDGYNNTTEYLSKHNNHGFCKLYNKTSESKLSEIVTRFEITLKKFDYKSVSDVFPNLHIYDNSQITMDENLSELSQNDMVFVELLRLHPEYKKKLTSRKQNKFEAYLNYEAPLYLLDRDCYHNLINSIRGVFLP